MAFQMSSHPAHHSAAGRSCGCIFLALRLHPPSLHGTGLDALFAVIAFTGIAMGFRNATVRRVSMLI
jgi:hypothetical protein